MINLITGGAGFIGSNLALELINKDENVIIFDDLSSGDIRNFNKIKRDSNFTIITDSILNIEALEKAIIACDRIFHLAAIVGVDNVCKNQKMTKIINIVGTYNVANLAAKYCKKILFTSSSEVYGNSSELPYKENNISLSKIPDYENLNIYGKTKIIGEKIIKNLSIQKKLKAIIVRLFNISGAGQRDNFGMVIPNFVKHALTNKPLTIYGSGKHTRTFIHIKDAVPAIIDLMEKKSTIGNVFNLGGTKEISIENLAKITVEILKSKSVIQYMPYEQTIRRNYFDFKRRVPDVSKISSTIRFFQQADIDQIINDNAKYIKEIYSY